MGASGFGVQGAGPVVVGQDLSEQGCGGVFVAAAQGVDVLAGDEPAVLVVGFPGGRLVDVDVVVVFS